MFVTAIVVAVVGLAVLGLSFLLAPTPPQPAEGTGRAGKAARPQGDRRRLPRVAAALLLLLALLLAFLASIYTQSVGQAKVLINPGGTIAGVDETPGFGWKAPWQTTSDWDLFSQVLTYAGSSDGAVPEYTGGEINGLEVTSSVSGGAQTNFDLSVTYNLQSQKVEELYRQYRDQARFTKQVIEPQVLAVTRDVPTAYRPVDFRGEKRGEATQRLTDALTERLGGYGVAISTVSLQNIRFTDEVEQSIKAVEVAQQKEAEAEANLRATEVSAQARVVEAQAEAEANRLLSESLTPQVLEQRRIEAMKAGTVFVVPEGSTPLVQVPAQP
ncbi:SPFH domain-containing protein [Cellulomonas endophytica]|uniref:SPFH domain-containing protein n=1 Tax=Cellulomonas endophytica TaxID=2494735 RepID=UPI0013E91FF5|nr:SPFH domain-containing protein [Cellulomonas endophytica]